VLDFADKRISRDLARGLIAYLEVCATDRQGGEGERAGERRRSLRPPLPIPVRIAGADGTESVGECVDLSLFGMKVRPHGPLALDSVVKLSFIPPDETAPLEVLAVPVREDSDGHGFRFVSLSEATFRRLEGVVRREAERQGWVQGELDALVGPTGVAASKRPAKDPAGGRAPRASGRAQ
jgi:hypothetical protein